MPDYFDAILTFMVLIAVLVGMAREWRSPDVLALAGAGSLVATGVLETGELRAVFSNPGALTVGAMFVIGGALQSTGAVALLGGFLQRFAARRSPAFAVVGVMLAVMTASAFVNNTAIVVIMTPVVIAMARSYSEAPSRFLIPLSYASIFGGSCTLIGSSTNLLVDGVATAEGLRPFGIFEMTLPGLLLGIVGLIYLAIFGPRLLPARKSAADVLEDDLRKSFLTEIVITSASDLSGKPLSKVSGRETEIVQFIRDGGALETNDDMTLKPGDRVIVRAPAGEAMHLRGAAEPSDDDERSGSIDESLLPGGFEVAGGGKTGIREGIVRPGSHYQGREVGALNLSRLYDVRILAVHRHGGEMRRDFERVRLQVGDSLLLEGPPEGLKRLFDSSELVNLGEPLLHRTRTEKAPVAVGAVVAVVLLAALDVLPLAGIAIIAAVALLVTGCIRVNAARDAIDWSVLFLIFGMLAIGRALETSGAISLLVAACEPILSGLTPWLVLAAVYLVASVLTELVTNNAVAIVVTPIAIGLAEQLGFEPRGFAIAVMLAGSASFATPLGYQTNTFVYGAGNYRFGDFVRVGAPLNLLMWLAASLLIPVFWPLTS